jgi:DNA processing protein
MARDELADWLRLLLTPELGRASARKLLGKFGLPAEVFAQPPGALEGLLTAAQVQALQTEPSDLAEHLARTRAWLGGADATHQRRILTLADAEYPAGLLETPDPPLMLFAMGQLPPDWPVSIAVVGSRNPTPQGLVNARQFARCLAESGLTVVSGLALGIDGAAHEGALQGAAADSVATIAVVGTGLDRVYPARHRELAHRITLRGIILSEYSLGTPPLPLNFPRRNRIIAALSRGTLVVEAALQSGSLITARQAVEQGREVFAIPGSIHSPQSRGCHALLREGAKLVETAQDVLEELGPVTPTPAPSARRGTAGETEPEDPLTRALGFDPIGLDALVARTGLAPAELQARLLEMELAGRVARAAGGLYQRVASA